MQLPNWFLRIKFDGSREHHQYVLCPGAVMSFGNQFQWENDKRALSIFHLFMIPVLHYFSRFTRMLNLPPTLFALFSAFLFSLSLFSRGSSPSIHVPVYRVVKIENIFSYLLRYMLRLACGWNDMTPHFLQTTSIFILYIYIFWNSSRGIILIDGG